MQLRAALIATVLAAVIAAGCGDTPSVPGPEPAPVPERPALTGVDAIAIGTLHGCALVSGRVWCWGWPDPGGSAAPAAEHLAEPVVGLADVVELRAGGKQTCARTAEGALWCWGERFVAPGASDPQVAVWNPLDGPPGSMLPRFHPQPVRVAIERVASFDVGRAHACAIDDAGGLFCWGSDANHEIGAYAGPEAPHRVAEHASALDAGPFYTCFDVTSQALRELRVARPAARPVPMTTRRCLGAPPELSRASAADPVMLEDAVASMACLLVDGRVSCERIGVWAPTDFAIPDFDDVTSLALGAYHGCVARRDGSVWCWGQSMMGQLGPSNTTGTGAVVTGVTARALGAGPFRTCALTSEGSVVCWGDNEHGSCGADVSTRTVGVTVVRRAAE